MGCLIQLENLTKTYAEGDRERLVLSGIDVCFDEGEFVVVRGRSGSGKTTLLNLLAGIDLPTAGEITMDGVRLTSLSSRARTLFRRDNIGFIFQFFHLIPTLTVHENVALPAELAAVPKAEADRRALELLERVGLVDRRSDYPDRLSGGEQQRVAIARALVQHPRLLLADEPTGNLDDKTGSSVMSLLIGLTHEFERTLILATHSRRIAALASRNLTLEAGRLVEDLARRSVRAAAFPGRVSGKVEASGET